MSTLDSILAQLNDEAVTMKTASDNTQAPGSNEDAALQAVRAATKIASVQAPQHYSGDAVAALHKMAAETAAMEDAMMAKQAQDYGVAICDGFMQRLAQYDGAFGTDKTASAGVSQADLEKVAAAYYEQGAIDFEKTAAAQYEAGYNETMAQVHKIASDLHIAGQSNAREIVAALGGSAAARPFGEKRASVADAALAAMGRGAAVGGGLGVLGGGIRGAMADEENRLRGAVRGGYVGGTLGAMGGALGGMSGTNMGAGLGSLAGAGLGVAAAPSTVFPGPGAAFEDDPSALSPENIGFTTATNPLAAYAQASPDRGYEAAGRAYIGGYGGAGTGGAAGGLLGTALGAGIGAGLAGPGMRGLGASAGGVVGGGLGALTGLGVGQGIGERQALREMAQAPEKTAAAPSMASLRALAHNPQAQAALGGAALGAGAGALAGGEDHRLSGALGGAALGGLGGYGMQPYAAKAIQSAANRASLHKHPLPADLALGGDSALDALMGRAEMLNAGHQFAERGGSQALAALGGAGAAGLGVLGAGAGMAGVANRTVPGGLGGGGAQG